MDEAKRAQILEKFIDKLPSYDWTSDGSTSFIYEKGKTYLHLTRDRLSIQNEYNTGNGANTRVRTYDFDTSSNKKLGELYLELEHKSKLELTDFILEFEPSIKREVGIEDLLNEQTKI